MNTLVNEMGKAAAFICSSGLVLHSVYKDKETEGQAGTRYPLLFAGSFEGGRPFNSHSSMGLTQSWPERKEGVAFLTFVLLAAASRKGPG